MGKKNRGKYFKKLDELAQKKLESMLSFGESKSEARKDDEGITGHIYSENTYRGYLSHARYFAKWVMENHPECTTLKAAKQYVPEWLQYRADYVKKDGKHYSAWTINKDTSALNKLYELDGTDDAFRVPEGNKRERGDIKRSRTAAERDRHFSKTGNEKLIHFCEGVGARRSILEKMKGDDYWPLDRMQAEFERLSTMDKSTLTKKEKAVKWAIKEALETYAGSDIEAAKGMQHFVLHRQDKGGKYRFSPIIGPYQDEIIKRFEETGKNDKVWPVVHSACDIHYYRGIYAKTLYKMTARKIEDIPHDKYHAGIHQMVQSDVYACRKEEAGQKFDKKALQICTQALGHNRLNVVVDNYLYDIWK